MPPWLEFPLTLIAIFATFFFLAWLLARDRLTWPVRLLGWGSVGVTLAAFLWSLWAESLAPSLRSGRTSALALTLAQAGVALLGTGLMLIGAVHFLQAWLGMGWVLHSEAPSFLRDSPAFAEVREQSTPAARWDRARALMGRVLRLPGLGWIPLGLGMILLAFQLLEPDSTLSPDPFLVGLGMAFIALGLGQMLLRERKGR